MRRPNSIVIVLLSLLAATLAVLATLQYRWIDRVSDAERQQMHANADFAARRFIEDLSRELVHLHSTFVADGDVVAQYKQWASTTGHRKLVRNVYLIERYEEWTLHLVDDNGALAEVPWPAELEVVREHLPNERPRRGPPNLPAPFFSEIPALFIVEPRGSGGPPRGEFGGDMFGGPPRPPRMVLLHLDPASYADFIVPRAGLDVAVLSGDRVMYRSDPAWPDGKSAPDIELDFSPFTGPRRPERISPPSRVLVRRHDGSVDAIVSAARRRNLAVSFGIVLILALTAAVLVALLRRAERLRRQQLEFVAAISHELNTPVAALRSAGENLRDGIIHDSDKLSRYGSTIVRESTRLGELTAQVLELAGMQERRARNDAPVDVATVIADAVSQCDWLVARTPVKIETNVDPDLPAVHGDGSAIMRALQNLIANAIRHGGAGEWVGVRATREGDCVAITVEDRGPGVDPSDAEQLFDAFYRGRNSSAVPGAGLGLAIVRQVALAHGGSVRIDKRRSGAAFTIELPAASHA
ncbi:MAG TPA: HAMP domain-containing sensor histidine kinase [Thermoanaerobaculia bacterium]|nr:HAMP domain-containing sensor histidine kinase [Thermoanaerobaculia bacterium]